MSNENDGTPHLGRLLNTSSILTNIEYKSFSSINSIILVCPIVLLKHLLSILKISDYKIDLPTLVKPVKITNFFSVYLLAQYLIYCFIT